MLEAQEFIISHTERRAGRAIHARDLSSFLHQRGKIDVAIARYDSRLQKDPKDIVALHVMAIIYSRIKEDAELAGKYELRLDQANREIASKLAERLEKDAATAPQTAAFHSQGRRDRLARSGRQAEGPGRGEEIRRQPARVAYWTGLLLARRAG